VLRVGEIDTLPLEARRKVCYLARGCAHVANLHRITGVGWELHEVASISEADQAHVNTCAFPLQMSKLVRYKPYTLLRNSKDKCCRRFHYDCLDV